jgi:peptidoglycan/xylan/chitin deacetylase (PgdA/CDA1 family)
VVFISANEETSTEQRQMDLATHFYGLNLKVLTTSATSSELNWVVAQPTTLGVAIDANALALLNRDLVLRALHRGTGTDVPVLIVGITQETDPGVLRSWSEGAAVGCRRFESPVRPQYVVGRVAGITQQLSDLHLPFLGDGTCYLATSGDVTVQNIAEARDEHRAVPVFIKTNPHHQRIFLASKMGSQWEKRDGWNADHLVSVFAEIGPAMMFSKYCAGEQGWHTLHHYANLTIDDPWLRESYGYLNYSGLLGEMKKYNFHTTIAFIPWNYDRSQPEVVSIFRNHPDKFSICIHGDNHDHKEFTDYVSKPLTLQITALKQALARMNRFQMLTGIPYDKVMIFPHSIAPQRTLNALKTYNYLATVNSFNAPMDRPSPAFLPFSLRPVTVEYSNFASIRRYPVEVPPPTEFIAVNEFLDNPLLFYCHHNFFANTIGAFDSVADQVNKVEQDTHWVSLGEIVKHLYLVRLRDDSGYDVLSFSSDFSIENISGRNSIFHVKKQESGTSAIKSVTVDGKEYPYRLNDGFLDLTIPILAGKSSDVLIQYENDLNLPNINISQNSARIYLLRMASDLRDISLPRHAAGRALIALYYADAMTRAWAFVCFSILITFCVFAGLSLRKRIDRSNRVGRAGTRG